MKVLIIDDLIKKYRLIQRVFNKIDANAEYVHCRTSNSARAILKSYSFDLIFLDMSFNTNDNPSENAAWEGLAGLRVLQMIYRLRIKTKVIIFTAHSSDYKDPYNSEINTLDDLNKHVAKYFPEICLGCIYSKQSEESLVRKIRTLLL